MATSGNVTDEVWKEYIANQKPPEPDGDFRVVKQQPPVEWPINPAFIRNWKGAILNCLSVHFFVVSWLLHQLARSIANNYTNDIFTVCNFDA